MKAVWLSRIVLTVALGCPAVRASEQPAPPPSSFDNELDSARRQGWQMATRMVDHLRANKPNSQELPGIAVWLEDFSKQTKGLDPNGPVDRWPKVDCDALTTHNPHFWRMYFEIGPGDPGSALLYAGILSGCGEFVRASHVLEMQQFRPGMTEATVKALAGLYLATKNAPNKTTATINEGIVLFDKGDYPGAIAKYQDALKQWPQCGWAAYELGYTLHTQNQIAAGVKPETPKTGFAVRVNSDVKVRQSEAVKAAYAQSRLHTPFAANAYQGDDPQVLAAFMALAGKALPAMQYLGKKRTDDEMDQAMEQFVEGCQEANLHDLALVMRQILVARRGQYDKADHPIFVKSLRALVPGKDTEDVLERLARPTAAFYRLIPTGPSPPRTASTRIFDLTEPQYIQEKGEQDVYTIIVSVEAQKAEQFEKPGTHVAYAMFNRSIEKPPTSVEWDPAQLDSVTFDKGGTPSITWDVRSELQGLTGKAAEMLAPPIKPVGKRGVLRFGLHGLPDTDMVFFLYSETKAVSNVLFIRKKDFTAGSGEQAYQAAVAKLNASEPAKQRGK